MAVFHWTQAVWQKVQSPGLSTFYDDNATHKYIVSYGIAILAT